jgi:uncharacterized protein YndB with AHSA1/START domain
MEEHTSTMESGVVSREVAVSAPPAAAFALFTAHIGAWWPLTGKNVLGPDGSVGFEDGALVERQGASSEIWAEVVAGDPPAWLRLAFYPRVGPAKATDLVITFSPAGDGTCTRLGLEHRGWERLAGDASDAARAGVDQGWGEVLDAYRDRVNRGDQMSPDPCREPGSSSQAS